jgi:hypothetical protein
MAKKLKIGNRVRAKMHTMSGWKGTGTYIGNGMVIKDFLNTIAEFCDDELAKMRDQIPNPRHVAIIGESNDPYEIRNRVYDAKVFP